MKCLLRSLIASATLCAVALAAPPPDPSDKYQQLVAGLSPQLGKVAVKNSPATFDLPDDYAFLNAADAKTVLCDIWGNPRDSSVLGLIVPKGFDPLAADSWAAVLSFNPTGYRRIDDADTLDYTTLMKEMQEGYQKRIPAADGKDSGKMELIQWTKDATYDGAHQQILWGKEFATEGSPEHTLNYSLRIMGKTGVLELTGVSGTGGQEQMEKEIPHLASKSNLAAAKWDGEGYYPIEKIAFSIMAILLLFGLAIRLRTKKRPLQKT